MYFSSMWNQKYLWPLPNTPEAEPVSASINLSLGNSKTTEGGLSVHIEHIFVSIYSEICSYICNIILSHTEFKHKAVPLPILFSPKASEQPHKTSRSPQRNFISTALSLPLFSKTIIISSEINITCFILSRPLHQTHTFPNYFFLSPVHQKAQTAKKVRYCP